MQKKKVNCFEHTVYLLNIYKKNSFCLDRSLHLNCKDWTELFLQQQKLALFIINEIYEFWHYVFIVNVSC